MVSHKRAPPTPVFVPPPFTWTGFYIGLNAGAVIASGSRNATLVVPAADVWLNSYFPGGIGNNKTGFIGGGQAGYDWQTGAFVFGVVTDFDGTTLSKNFNFSSVPFTAAGIYNGDTLNVNAKASLDWLGTTRGKVGFVVTPDNRLMIYGTGGVAYGGGSAHFNVYDQTYNAYWSGNPSSTRVGWTIGGGVEYAFTKLVDRRRISLRRPRKHARHYGWKLRRLHLLPERLRDGEAQLQRVDCPRFHKLQVLSAGVPI